MVQGEGGPSRACLPEQELGGVAAQRSEQWLVHDQRVGAVLEALGHARQVVLWPACNSSGTGNVQRQV